MSNGAVDALVKLMVPEVRDGILYKCFCSEFGVTGLTADELWDLFDVRWAALSEVRFDKGLEAFLMRDDADSESSTVQLAALDPAGHVIGGLRVHLSPIHLLDELDGVQISRVGVSWEARGAGIGAELVGRALRIAKALGMVKGLPLAFLLGRVLDTDSPNRVLSFYERIGFRRTNLYTVTKSLSNCLMLAGIQRPSLHYLRSQGFQVEEAQERGALYPTLLIASSVARQIQTAGQTEQGVEEVEDESRGLLLQGRYGAVRPFLKTDLPMLHQWEHRSDPPGYACRSHALARTMAELEAEFKLDASSTERQRFAVDTNEGQLIGYVLYYGLQSDTRNVSISVEIGEADCWAGEWGREAVWLLVEYLFDRLGAHKISAQVSVGQEQVWRDLESLGFKRDGVLRDHELAEGRYVDYLLMSLLEDEYRYH
ncbi:MAG: GNAT family N-acetyltransferase [Anaerolineae bacterium]|nr:GNAT family N-acetyltransferase [Anaerolineae bacterium]